MAWIARLIGRRVDRELKPLGLVSSYLPVLFSLMDGSGRSTGALAKISAIEQPTMTMTLSRMERDGLVERQPDPADRRSSLFFCTDIAREKASAAKEIIDRMNLEILSALPARDRARYSDNLRTLIDRFSDSE